MRTVKTYRLGHDDYVIYALPSRKKALLRMESTHSGPVYDMIERRMVEGGVPEPWPKFEAIPTSSLSVG